MAEIVVKSKYSRHTASEIEVYPAWKRERWWHRRQPCLTVVSSGDNGRYINHGVDEFAVERAPSGIVAYCAREPDGFAPLVNPVEDGEG